MTTIVCNTEMYLQGGTIFIFEEVCGSRIKFRFDLLNNLLSFERISFYTHLGISWL